MDHFVVSTFKPTRNFCEAWRTQEAIFFKNSQTCFCMASLPSNIVLQETAGTTKKCSNFTRESKSPAGKTVFATRFPCLKYKMAKFDISKSPHNTNAMYAFNIVYISSLNE